jgi:hypothetical protein
MLSLHSYKMLVALSGLALAAPRAAEPAGGQPTRDVCVLQYERADNMWADAGSPIGNLGAETITLPAGGTQWFNTDWHYEKTRNDGVHYYGSHLRLATNAGGHAVALSIREPLWNGQVTLQPGATSQFRHDLYRVTCP